MNFTSTSSSAGVGVGFLRRSAPWFCLFVFAGLAGAQAPRLDSITPAWGVAAGSTRLVVRGAGFDAPGAGVPSVTLGGVEALNVKVVDDLTIECRAPAAAVAGLVNVTVTTQFGQRSLANAYWYRPNDPPLRILPLGDSITESLTGYASYRYYLWHLLLDGGYVVDFTGTRTGVASGPPLYSDFDQQHQAISGMFTDQAVTSIQAWIAGGPPDVVLIHLGTNDMLASQSVASTISELEEIIDRVRQLKPTAMFLVAQIIPHNLNQGIPPSALNAAMPGIVSLKDNPNSRVVLVDQYTGFSPALHLRDGVHPNDLGEQLMAARWYAALRQLLIPRKATVVSLGQGCDGGVGNLVLSGDPALIGGCIQSTTWPLPPHHPPVLTGIGIPGFSSFPLPLDLGLFGAPNCALQVDAFAWFNVDPFQGGWFAPVPNELFLTGSRFTQQSLLFDPTLNALGFATSNAAEWTLGDQ